MTADNHIHAQVANALRHGLLAGVGLELVLLPPVDIQHDGLRPLLPHLCNLIFQLGIEGFRVCMAEASGPA